MRRLIFLLPIFLLLLNQQENSVFVKSLGNNYAYANIDTLYAVFGGRLYSSNATQATARNATTATSLDSVSTFSIGNQYAAGAWNYFRGFFGFNMPDMASINSLVFELNGGTDRSETDTLWNIFSASQAASGGITTADFDQFNIWQASGAYNGVKLISDWNTTSYSINWNTFTFNAAGKDTALVYKNSTFYFMVDELRDYYDVWAVGDSCYITFEGTDGNDPRLIVNYEITSPPAATNDNAQYLFRNGQPVYYHKNGQPLKRRPE